LNNKINIFNIALTDKTDITLPFIFDSTCPGSSSISSNRPKEKIFIKATRLDDLIGEKLSEYDVLIFKIDVEGHEREVLEGSRRVLGKVKSFLLIEDFVKPDIIEYCNKRFYFKRKLTPYNSWWGNKA